MSSALFEFMPYGAPEILDGARRRLFRATTWSMVLWVLVFVAILGATLLRPRFVDVPRTVVVPYRELGAPPPLSQVEPPPAIGQVTSVSAPTAGVPVPVPDAEAPPQQTIASQQEIAATTGSVEVTDRPIVVEPMAAEEMPRLGEYVYTDELPVLITDVLPKYPEIARDAGIDGDVLLRVLVGKDGRVLNVHVDKSIPMLDQSAVEAARQWVFKPALSNNRPIAVWISRRVRFSLTSGPS
jgi:protein TonB